MGEANGDVVASFAELNDETMDVGRGELRRGTVVVDDLESRQEVSSCRLRNPVYCSCSCSGLTRICIVGGDGAVAGVE